MFAAAIKWAKCSSSREMETPVARGNMKVKFTEREKRRLAICEDLWFLEHPGLWLFFVIYRQEYFWLIRFLLDLFIHFFKNIFLCACFAPSTVLGFRDMAVYLKSDLSFWSLQFNWEIDNKPGNKQVSNRQSCEDL